MIHIANELEYQAYNLSGSESSGEYIMKINTIKMKTKGIRG